MASKKFSNDFAFAHFQQVSNVSKTQCSKLGKNLSLFPEQSVVFLLIQSETGLLLRALLAKLLENTYV